jgi:hypothetical protein
MFVVIVFFSDNKSINKIKLFTPFLAGLIVISPWYVRNYVNFEDIFYTSNAGVYLQLQYIQLQHKGSGWSRDQGEKEYNKYFSQYLQNRSVEEQELCLNHQRDWFCNEALSSHAINMITSEPPVVHLRALMDSWLTLFLAGGASNYRNYLGIDGKNVIVGFQRRAYKGIDSIIYLVKEMNFPYFFIFVLTTLFTIFTRLIGVIGLFVLFRDRKLRLYGVLLFEVISIFTAAYLYLGQSRFRVPLEPMLMLLTVVGIVYLVSRSKVKNT